jgi:hypothetical protein
MAENLNLNVNVNTSGAESSVGSLKKQLREAQQEVAALSDKFGATSKEAIEAAKRAGELKDRIGDAKALTDAFNPDAKFKAFTASLSGVAGGFGAVQGAMALFGAESDNVQKTLLKVQSAMAISQGLQAVGESIDSFKQMKAVAIDAFKGIKAAIGSTGIGLLLVALGTLVAYWDDIKEAVSGVGEEQKKLNETSKENLKTQEDKLDAIDGQSNQLKLQGKSEKEILDLKIKQSDEAIKAAEINLANAKATKDAQVKAAERNKQILQGIITFLSAPLVAVLTVVDQVGKALGKDFGLAEGFTGGLAKMVFDPAETAKEGDNTIREAEAALNKLKEKKAGFQLAIQGIDKADRAKSKADNDAEQKKVDEANAILREANKKLKSQEEQEFLNIEESYKEKRKKLKEAGIKDNGDLAAAEKKERDAITDKYAKEEAAKIEAYEKELAKIRLENKLAAIKDENEKARAQLMAAFEQQRQDIDANEKYTAEQKIALKLALATQEETALAALKLTADKKQAETDIADLDKEIIKAAGKFDVERELLDNKDALLKDSFDKGLINEKAYNEGVEANANARIEIDKKEAAAKIENAMKISALLSGLSDVVGKETAAGKAFAVASATIDTYLAATKAYQSMSGIPIVGPALGAVAAGVAIAGGIKNVKAIMGVKVPGGGGGSNPTMPSVSTSAPMTPQLPMAQTTNISQQSINDIGNQAVRAYVVESDVTSNQQRIAAIRQRARFS